MSRSDLGYVILTASSGLMLFYLGRWSAPTPPTKVLYVASVAAAPVEEELIPLPSAQEIPPPPLVAIATATANSKLPAEIKSYSLEPELSGEHAAPAPRAPAAPVVAPAPPLMPEPIVLEEIPDNPYKRDLREAPSRR